MFRIGFVLFWVLLSCSNKKKSGDKDNGFSYSYFSERFKPAKVPFQMTDAELLGNRDTGSVRSSDMAAFVPDSIRSRIFGKSAKVRYVPLYRLESGKDEIYYVLKAASGARKAALLLVFDRNGEFGSSMPFLVPDEDPATSQVSTIDRSYSISRGITQRKTSSPNAEGKDVYAYSSSSRQFSLIMTDVLNEATIEVVNPIDTFSRKHKLAGDYLRDKKNYISIRDGRHPNQLLFFIHLDKNKGACIGELKGDLLITSATTAIYRQGGDPCVLSFRFSGASVTVKEDEGCGSHRGLDCVFEGSFTRKKEARPKAGTKNAIKK